MQIELDLQVALAAAQMATEGFAGPALAKTVARARRLCQELRSDLLSLVLCCFKKHTIIS